MSSTAGAVFYTKGKYTQTCGFCGCVFNVEVPGRMRHEEPEIYHCPECNRRYSETAAAAPTVTLLGKRTDGLRKKYKNQE